MSWLSFAPPSRISTPRPSSVTGLDTTTNHTLTFIVGDTSDDELDTTVYLASLGGTPPQPVPEPATLSLFGLGLLGLAFRRRKAGLGYYGYTYWAWHKLTNMPVILFLGSLFVVMRGIVSKQISALHYRFHNEQE